jgi:hypothetical protein
VVDRVTPRFFVTTRLIVRPDVVAGRRRLFTELWNSGFDPD